MARTLIAGNWKMNGLMTNLSEITAVGEGLARLHSAADCLLCVPATLLGAAANAASGTSLKIGGETCHPEEGGAHTGDISAEMLKDAGASYVIVGHSERRADHGESDSAVAAQASAALRGGLIPIICVGETLEERKSGRASEIISAQLTGSIPEDITGDTFVIAYEPVWAIGTGEVATPVQIGEIHGQIRAHLTAKFGDAGGRVPILYGGSMKPGNAAEILTVADVNGGLIGGASLKAEDFLAIYEAAKN